MNTFPKKIICLELNTIDTDDELIEDDDDWDTFLETIFF